MNKYVMMAVAALLFVSAQDTFAGKKDKGGRKGKKDQTSLLATLDKDKDGKISEAEYVVSADKKEKKKQGRMFGRMDANQDGFLDKSELSGKK